FVSHPIGFQTDQNPHLLDALQRRINFVKATDVEVAYKAVKQLCVLCKQSTEPIPQIISGLVRNESQVRRHRYLKMLSSNGGHSTRLVERTPRGLSPRVDRALCGQCF